MKRNNRSRIGTKGLGRNQQRNSAAKRVLIVTEGSKTEPAYFDKLIEKLGISSVKITTARGKNSSSPINVVESAIERLRGMEFDIIYCVFDRDCHPSYEEAVNKIRKISGERYKRNKIYAITSVPCFEVWYLLHVSDSNRPYGEHGSPCVNLIDDLKKIHPFENYSKNDDIGFLDQIFGNQEKAIKRAKKILSNAKEAGIREFHEDPSTRIHEIVEELMKIPE